VQVKKGSDGRRQLISWDENSVRGITDLKAIQQIVLVRPFGRPFVIN
jgi:hypothetical protein